MSQETSQPNVILKRMPEYREGYANSVQVQKSVWDFRLTFGTAYQETAEEITINAFQTVYLSPQQAKALCGLLEQNLLQYASCKLNSKRIIAIDFESVTPDPLTCMKIAKCNKVWEIRDDIERDQWKSRDV